MKIWFFAQPEQVIFFWPIFLAKSVCLWACVCARLYVRARASICACAPSTTTSLQIINHHQGLTISNLNYQKNGSTIDKMANFTMSLPTFTAKTYTAYEICHRGQNYNQTNISYIYILHIQSKEHRSYIDIQSYIYTFTTFLRLITTAITTA